MGTIKNISLKNIDGNIKIVISNKEENYEKIYKVKGLESKL